MSRCFYLSTLFLPWWNRNVHIIRIGSNAFHWSSLTPELTRHNSHPRTVVVRDFRNRAGRNVLIARVCHLHRRGQVCPQLKTMHAAVLVTLGHLLVENAAAGGHPLHITGRHLAFVS